MGTSHSAVNGGAARPPSSPAMASPSRDADTLAGPRPATQRGKASSGRADMAPGTHPPASRRGRHVSSPSVPGTRHGHPPPPRAPGSVREPRRAAVTHHGCGWRRILTGRTEERAAPAMAAAAAEETADVNARSFIGRRRLGGSRGGARAATLIPGAGLCATPRTRETCG